MFTAGKPASLCDAAQAIVPAESALMPTPACDTASRPRASAKTSLDTAGTSALCRKILAQGTNPALLVGRPPRSGCPLGQDALDPPPAQRDRHLAWHEQADGGVGRGPGGPPHRQRRPFVAGKACATSAGQSTRDAS